MDVVLNMGFFNITDNVPIDLCSCGAKNKNKEVKFATKYITENINIFKNNILIADRFYFTYEFINFLEDNNIKYIIRVKGDGKYLKKEINVTKNNINYTSIVKLKDKVRVITYKNVINKTVHVINKKKCNTKYQLEIKNDCVLVTNLLDDKKYTDSNIMDLYRSRWDIEIFFKYLKGNLNFQHIKEKNIQESHKKIYICELIIMYIAKIIEKHYYKSNKVKKNNEKYTFSINKSLLINSLYDKFLYKLLNNGITNKYLNSFSNLWVKIIQNKKGRTFPRSSKEPFSKWYIKGYSNDTKYTRILNALFNDNINDLDKNLKTLLSKFISINGSDINKFYK